MRGVIKNAQTKYDPLLTLHVLAEGRGYDFKSGQPEFTQFLVIQFPGYSQAYAPRGFALDGGDTAFAQPVASILEDMFS